MSIGLGTLFMGMFIRTIICSQKDRWNMGRRKFITLMSDLFLNIEKKKKAVPVRRNSEKPLPAGLLEAVYF